MQTFVDLFKICLLIYDKFIIYFLYKIIINYLILLFLEINYRSTQLDSSTARGRGFCRTTKLDVELDDDERIGSCCISLLTLILLLVLLAQLTSLRLLRLLVLDLLKLPR
jgi:hypothetical protein